MVQGPPSSSSRASAAPIDPASSPLFGGFRGSALYHSVEHFQKKHGNAAAHAVIARLPASMRQWVTPNAPALGVLGARVYPYPFVGELVRTMRAVVKAPDEDLFVRELVNAGLDVLLSTMHRVVLRYLVTPASFLERRQEIWGLFHTAGRLRIVSQTSRSYTIEDADWSNTDGVVCKVNLEGRVRMLGEMRLPGVEVVREKCRAWGHDACVTKFKWGA